MILKDFGFNGFSTDDESEASFEVSCDYCPTQTEYKEMSWSELIEQMKEDGWLSKKIREEWKHACSLCHNKILKDKELQC